MGVAKFTPKDAKRDRRAFSREEMASRLSYDPESGFFVWKVRVMCCGGGRMPGDRAGTAKDGYVEITLFGRRYRAHHLAWLAMTGEWPPLGVDIDHANRMRDDNRWANLRLASRSENNVNSKGRKDNTSGAKGVHKDKRTGRYFARITHKGNITHLGMFDTLESAAAARAVAESSLYGDFSRRA